MIFYIKLIQRSKNKKMIDEKKLLELEISYDHDLMKTKQSKSCVFAIMWFKDDFIDVLVFMDEKYIYVRPVQKHPSFEFEQLFNFDLESSDFDNKRVVKMKKFPLHPWSYLSNRKTVYDHLIKKELYPELILKYNL